MFVKAHTDWSLEETWLSVRRWPNYEVSNNARVRNAYTGRVLRAQLRGNQGKKYHCVTLGRVSYKIAELMLEAFVEPRPPGRQALHRDDDQLNDCLTNLYWGTPQDNALDREANWIHARS